MKMRAERESDSDITLCVVVLVLSPCLLYSTVLYTVLFCTVQYTVLLSLLFVNITDFVYCTRCSRVKVYMLWLLE